MQTYHKHIISFREKYNDVAYATFRILIGTLFMFHGAQKLFGAFTDKAAQPLFSLMGLAGIIEFFGGILIAVGLFTATAALFSAATMLSAYFMAHFAMNNPLPIANKGELALVYLAAFLYIAFEGHGKYSLSTLLFRD
jgi:putative oxidoreductase